MKKMEAYNVNQCKMSKMWKYKGSVDERIKQARMPLAGLIRLVVFDMDYDQMVYRSDDLRFVRLVDGYHTNIRRKGLCLAVQKVVFQQEKNLFLP